MRRLHGQVSRGEVRSFTLALRSLKDQAAPAWSLGELTNDQNQKLRVSDQDLRHVQSFTGGPQYKGLLKVDLLVAGLPGQLQANATEFLQWTLQVPTGALPGIYHGELTIGELSVHLDLEVLDLDFTWPGRGRGLFLPGSLHRTERALGQNWAVDTWTEEALIPYFRFFVSRGFNSPYFYHVEPQIRLQEGQIESDWREIDTIIQSLRQAGVTGPVGLDLRFLVALTNGAARNALQDDGTAIYTVESHAKDYSVQAKSYFRTALRQMLAIAKANQWGELKLHVEEEVNNTPGHKVAMVDAFTDILIEEAGADQVVSVDNPYGGWWPPIDRASRDGIPTRLYVEWTAEGLTQTRAEGGIIQNYNQGFERYASGLLQLATGSTGYYHWADNWCNWRSNAWAVSHTVGDGVFSSPAIERVREGFSDWFYGQEHRRMEECLRESGLRSQADAMQASRMQITGPMEHTSIARREMKALSEVEMNAMRSKLIAEIDVARRALHESPIRPVRPAPEVSGETLTLLSLPQPALQRSEQVASVAITTPIVIDGVLEAQWEQPDNLATQFRWQVPVEERLRRESSTEEEFHRKVPSGTSARFVHNQGGLYIQLISNHVDPDRASDLPNGIGDLRYDDSIEVYFNSDDRHPEYRLIINSKGRYAWLREMESISNSIEVTSVRRNPNGIQQEIFIPWSNFGLGRAPENGSQWLINICRLWRGQLSSFVQLRQGRGGLGAGALMTFVSHNAAPSGWRITEATRMALPGDAIGLHVQSDTPDPLTVTGTLSDATGRSWTMTPATLEPGRTRLWLTLPSDIQAGVAQGELRVQDPALAPATFQIDITR